MEINVVGNQTRYLSLSPRSANYTFLSIGHSQSTHFHHERKKKETPMMSVYRGAQSPSRISMFSVKIEFFTDHVSSAKPRITRGAIRNASTDRLTYVNRAKLPISPSVFQTSYALGNAIFARKRFRRNFLTRFQRVFFELSRTEEPSERFRVPGT